MRNLLSIAFVSIIFLGCSSTKSVTDTQPTQVIATSMDITKVVNDQLPVVIDPAKITEAVVTYRLPKVVPGTYSVSSFGRFVEDFKALDYNGNELTFEQTDENTWVIQNATQLDKITYLVNDTFDIEKTGGIGEDIPFSPAGTNIEPSNYVLNLHGFIGYFDHLKNSQYTLDITSPATFVRTSALQETAAKSNPDGTKIITSYYAPRYFDITDNPMMLGKLDVEEFMVGDIKIVLSVYSPNEVHTAKGLKETVYSMMQGQKAYLGDMNSTPRYDVYLYLSEGKVESPKGYGALEHHTSTVVVLQEASSKEALAKSMIDVVAHEFFHIVTPLSVHSEDVHYFDYHQPTFSKHLWMYEGVTEYFAQHFQVHQGLMTDAEFYDQMMSKIGISKYFDDEMSFTVMSENILDKPYADNYINVYQKGVLIGMCIDILMREESNGTRSMLSLMKELSNKYGKNKPFVDDNLIAEITAMTYPSVGEFLNTYVEGTTPIDYNVFFNKVGLTLAQEKVETNYIQSGTGFILKANQEAGTIAFNEGVADNSFWAENGAISGDVIKEINGTVLTMENAQMLFGQVYMWKADQDVEVKLDHNGQEVVIKKKLTPTFTTSEKLVADENATAAQVTLRNAWLKG
jgi:predicted metalloprotease with PDZ domain